MRRFRDVVNRHDRRTDVAYFLSAAGSKEQVLCEGQLQTSVP